MKGSISGYLSLRRMPTGRHVFALTQTRARIEELEPAHDTLIERVDAALEAGRAALREEFAWEQARLRETAARGNAVVLDNRLDVQISAIQAIAHARSLGAPDDPVTDHAHHLLRVAFPRGVAPITRQRFEVQLGMMDTLLEQLHGPLSTHVTSLGIEREVARLSSMVEEFRRELSLTQTPATRFDEVREVRDALHEHTAVVVLSVLAAFPGLDPESTRTRERVLGPIHDQQARVVEDYRRRRRTLDVDPVSGEEIERDPALDEGP